MTSSRLGLAAAVLVTLGLLLVVQRAPTALALGTGMVGNIAIPAIWAAAAMREPRPATPATAAAVAALAMLAVLGAHDGAAGVCHVIAGLAGGWTLAWRWRTLAILTVMALLLAPVVFLELDGTSVMEASRELNADNRRVFEENLPTGLSDSERAAALADFDRMSTTVLQLQERIWPAVLLLGLMVQAALALTFGWLAVRLTHGRAPPLERRPWEAWRAPFVTVWLLIGGLAAAVTRVDDLVTAGWSLALLAGLLLGIHGLALQTWFTRRVLSPIGRTLYWVLGALFFAPVMLGGGAVLGVVDQWWDLRRASGLAGPDQNDKS